MELLLSKKLKAIRKEEVKFLNHLSPRLMRD